MNGLNDLFGGAFSGAANVFHGPWSGSALQDLGQRGLVQEMLATLPCTPVVEPEERRQAEIASKNRGNYARWLARMRREPLQDVPFK